MFLEVFLIFFCKIYKKVEKCNKNLSKNKLTFSKKLLYYTYESAFIETEHNNITIKIRRRIKNKKTISILLSICMIFGLFAGTSFCTETAQAASAITSQDFLKANGKNLCNNYGNGSVVQLKGTNAGGYLIQEFWMTITNSTSHVTDEQDIYNKLTERFGTSGKDYLVGLYQDNYWTTTDFDNCAATGMNCIRLPFWYQNIRKSDGSLDFTRLDWFVSEAGKRGMYVVIDFHGAPGSQNGSDHSGIDGGNDKLGASQFFFGNNAYNNQKIYYDMWYKIAQHFAGNPT